MPADETAFSGVLQPHSFGVYEFRNDHFSLTLNLSLPGEIGKKLRVGKRYSIQLSKLVKEIIRRVGQSDHRDIDLDVTEIRDDRGTILFPAEDGVKSSNSTVITGGSPNVHSE